MNPYPAPTECPLAAQMAGAVHGTERVSDKTSPDILCRKEGATGKEGVPSKDSAALLLLSGNL